MECSIYRNDRILPIVVKEYFDEVKTEHVSWENMPRRMLRHRTIQQCARLAFGISSSEPYALEANKKLTPPPLVKSKHALGLSHKSASQTELLKHQLRT
jgi:hypothetical protein